MIQFVLRIATYLSICLIAAAGIICFGISLKPEYFLGAPSDYALAKYQYNSAQSLSAYKNIIVGDSRGTADINPRLLGDKWLNLSIPGSEVMEGYLTLKHYLSRNKVDTLIMFYGYEGFNEGLTYFEDRTIPWQFPTEDEIRNFELVEKNINREIHGNSVFEQTKLLFKQANRELRYHHFPLSYRNIFLDGITNITSSSSKPKMKEIERSLKQDLGHLTFGNLDSCDSISLHNLDRTFTPKRIQLVYLDSVISLAGRNNICTYLIFAPMNQATYDIFKNSVYRNSANPFLKSIANKHPVLHLITEPVFLPNSLFGDPLHLNKKGTIIFSEHLKYLLAHAKG